MKQKRRKEAIDYTRALGLLFVLLILFALFTAKVLLPRLGRYIEENGKLSLNAVVEQLQQTYDLQLGGYYRRLRGVESFLFREDEVSLSDKHTERFLASWQEEMEGRLFFLKENGAALTADGEQYRLDIPLKLLLELKENRNIAKVISLAHTQDAGSGFLLAIPCRQYTIGGETYHALGVILDRRKIDALLKLNGYEGNASLFMVDTNGIVIYTNKSGQIYFQNYSLLKHMKAEDFLTEEQTKQLERAFAHRKEGVELVGKGIPYYLGYRPIQNNDSMLVCVIPKSIVDNTLVSYQKTVFGIVFGVGVVGFLLLACLAYSVSRIHLVHQKMQFEEKSKQLQLQNMKELEAANEKLKLAQEATAEALRVAENANKAKSDFLSSMFHDIRTPMNAIVGITALLAHDASVPEKVKEYVRKIDVSSQHLLGIINDVLDMNKIESGKISFKNTDFPLSELVQEIDDVFRPQANAKQQAFEMVETGIVHAWVHGDKTRLMQVFGNLVSNAVKYTQEGGRIQFFVEECQTTSDVYAKYRFSVRDNGMGIDESFKGKLFEVFAREENSVTNKIQGTGLGLAIAKSLLDAMGGTIRVESEKGKGSCFEVLLNLRIARQHAKEPEGKAEKQVEDEAILHGMRFLRAEDNALNAEILQALLHMEGAECVIYENGQKVLEAFERSAVGEYDMIIMDVQMPVMNGYEATKAIRQSTLPLAKTIPIIAMTASAFTEDIQKALACGMNAHVSKPVEMRTLKKAVQGILFPSSCGGGEDIG